MSGILSVYADAYQWVEMPNTRGMALFADGGVLGSKPYAASGAYINRMSDYCRGCAYDVKRGGGSERLSVQLPVLGFHRPARRAARREPADGDAAAQLGPDASRSAGGDQGAGGGFPGGAGGGEPCRRRAMLQSVMSQALWMPTASSRPIDAARARHAGCEPLDERHRPSPPGQSIRRGAARCTRSGLPDRACATTRPAAYRGRP